MERLKAFIEAKKGSFSLEAVIAMMFVLMLIWLGVAYYTYLTPRQVLTQEVHTLATTAKLQGGLTESDIERFKDRLVEKGYVPKDKKDEIVVTAVAEDEAGNKKNVTSVLPLSEGYNDDPNAYSHRGSKEIITVTAQIPAKIQFLKVMLSFWNSQPNEKMYDYTFQETVMSERW
jgi:hypothetical protein